MSGPAGRLDDDIRGKLLRAIFVEPKPDEQIWYVFFECRCRRVSLPGQSIEVRFGVRPSRTESVVPNIEGLQRSTQARFNKPTSAFHKV
jgi:hypothetical protein